MSAENIATSYPEVAHLASFWESVWSFEALKESEGKHVAATLMTCCVTCGAARGIMADCSQHPRSTPAQDHAFHALLNFVFGPDVEGYPDRAAITFESVWETAGV